MTTSRRLTALAVAAAAGLLALAGTPVSPVLKARGASPTPLSFATATVVDPVNLYGEPDLRSDPGQPDTWYASGPWGTGTQKSIWNQSLDGTHTFRELHNKPDPLHTGGSILGPGGGDTEIAVDHNGKFYGSDLAALVTQNALVSTDRGKTFQQRQLPTGFADGSGTDRQWFGLWDPPNPAAARAASGYTGAFPVNYMVFLEAGAGSGESVLSSVPDQTNGSANVGLDYSCAPGALGLALCPHWKLNGDGFVFLDQLTGKVVQAIDYNSGASGASDQAAVEVVTPDVSGYMHSGVSPSDPKRQQMHTVFQLNKASTSAIFPVVTEDAQRNAYYVWVERPNGARTASSWQVYYSWSPPGADSQWNHWSAPIRVSAPPSATSIMPWAVAGGDGNLDVVWYGTDKPLSDPETDNDPLTAASNWYLYMAQVLHANTASPSITQVRAVDHPMHHGSICLSGLGCITIQGNRNLADYFEVSTDSTGAAYIVYNNTANDLIEQVPASGTPLPAGVVDHTGAEVVQVARQVGGPSLTGGYINQPTDIGVNSITARRNDAYYDGPTGRNYYPGLDITGMSLAKADKNLIVQVKVNDLSKVTAAAAAIGAPSVNFVARWEYKSKLYFAAVEMPAGVDAGLFYAGAAQSIDLCSVSACDPHILAYPGPTVSTASQSITGQVETATNTIRLVVPVDTVGSPQNGDHLDSVGAYSFVQNHSSYIPISNAEAQNDNVPIEVDGACCFTPTLGSLGTTTGVPVPPAGGNGGPVAGGGGGGSGLPPTATDGPVRQLAAGVMVMLLGGSAALLARRRRRGSRRA